MLVRSSGARAVRSSTRTTTTGVRVLLESSVARVLQSVAAAATTAEWSCARDCTLYPPRANLVYGFGYRGAINSLSDLRTTYSVACNTVAECSLPFVQCARVTRFAYHYDAPGVAAATTATTHNRCIAATTAVVAGTGCFSCGYQYFTFARATRLLLLLLLLLVNMVKQE